MLFEINKKLNSNKFNSINEVVDLFNDLADFIIERKSNQLYLRQVIKSGLIYNSFALEIIIGNLDAVGVPTIKFKLSSRTKRFIYFWWILMLLMSIIAIIDGVYKVVVIFIGFFLYSLIFFYLGLFFSMVKYRKIWGDKTGDGSKPLKK